jgi:hypothetical protein
VTVSRCFVEGAYEFLLKTGDREKHNEMVTAAVRKAAETNDVVVLAQGACTTSCPFLQTSRSLSLRVLSPESPR